MAFTRSVTQPKDSYSAAERNTAATIIARRVEVDPDCNVDVDYVLRLHRQGPFVTYTGTGADAGKLLVLSFLNKGTGVLRLAYFAPTGFGPGDRAELGRLIGRTVRDALNNGAELVYWYSDNRRANVHRELFDALATRIEAQFPEVQITDSDIDGGLFHRWEATL